MGSISTDYNDSSLIYSGPGVPFTEAPIQSDIQAIIHYLLCREDSIKHPVSSDLIRAVFVKENAIKLAEARQELRSVLAQCCAHLPPASDVNPILFEAFVGNLMALLPYTYPQPNDAFAVPIKGRDGIWRAHEYTVDQHINLPTLAYGLTSSNSGPPLLLFMGTTFPAGSGFTETLLSDFTPFASVGRASYHWGEKELNAWIGDKSDLRLYGASLGGALTFHTLLHHEDRIGQVYAYNPPGLYGWDWGRRRFDGVASAKVHIYWQQNDLVARMGQFPDGENVSIYRVSGEKPENLAKAHARAYTGGRQVTIIRGDADLENGSLLRRLLTLVHMIASLVLFIPLICLHVVARVLGKPTRGTRVGL